MKPHVVVMPNPRNRTMRFERLAGFADDVIEYLDPFVAVGDDGVCLDAPSIFVPNQATGVGLRHVGRSCAIDVPTANSPCRRPCLCSGPT